MGKIFGGSKNKSVQESSSNSTSASGNESASWNDAFPQLQETYTPTMENGVQANNALSALLGVGGDPTAQNAAFDNYRDSTGYNFKLDQGQRAITGSNAAKGLLTSGATAKALEGYGQNLASTTMNDYLSQLLGLGNQGIQAGSLVSGAGQKSKSSGWSNSTSNSTGTGTSSGSSKPGIGGLIGQIGAGVAASDRRLKKNITYLRTLDNGLNVYQYRYVNNKGPYIGVMADEVEKLMPEALGPEVAGYKTVDYSKIGMN